MELEKFTGGMPSFRLEPFECARLAEICRAFEGGPTNTDPQELGHTARTYETALTALVVAGITMAYVPPDLMEAWTAELMEYGLDKLVPATKETAIYQAEALLTEAWQESQNEEGS